jgi:hypothetical protein
MHVYMYYFTTFTYLAMLLHTTHTHVYITYIHDILRLLPDILRHSPDILRLLLASAIPFELFIASRYTISNDTYLYLPYHQSTWFTY